jgi:hypothetical protein
MALEKLDILPPSMGAQTKDASYFIDPLQSPDIMNMDLQYLGVAQTRAGKTLEGQAASLATKIVCISKAFSTTTPDGVGLVRMCLLTNPNSINNQIAVIWDDVIVPLADSGVDLPRDIQLANWVALKGKQFFSCLALGATGFRTFVVNLAYTGGNWVCTISNFVPILNAVDNPDNPPAEFKGYDTQPNLLCYWKNRLWGLNIYSHILYGSKTLPSTTDLPTGDNYQAAATAYGSAYDSTYDATYAVAIGGGDAAYAELAAYTAAIAAAYQAAWDAANGFPYTDATAAANYAASWVGLWDTATAQGDAIIQTIYDNDWGMGLAAQQSGLVVFKQNSITRVIGNNKADFIYERIYDTIGSDAPNAVCAVDNKVIFHCKYDGYYRVMLLDDGNGLTELGENIRTTLNTIIDDPTSVMLNTCATIYKEKYILTFLTASGYVVVKINYKTGAWEICDDQIAASCYLVDGGLYGSGVTTVDTKSTVYQLETGTDDNGDTITSYFKTKNFIPAGSEMQIALRWISIWAKASATPYDLKFKIYYNDKETPFIFKMPLGSKGGTETTRFEQIPLNQSFQGGFIALKFYTDGDNQPFTYYRAELFYEIVGQSKN